METVSVRVVEKEWSGRTWFQWACTCGVRTRLLSSTHAEALKGARTHATRSHKAFPGEVLVEGAEVK